MDVMLTPQQRAELEAAAMAEPGVRRWRRYQAVLLLAEGEVPARVARSLRCSRASVYGWAARWRRYGIVGLHEGDHGGGQTKLDAAGEARLVELLGEDPQARGHHATGWTVPLLRTELTQAGYVVADRTIRRALHRLGYRWKRPRYVLGRPDPDYEAKKGG
jgi:transposase